MMHMKNVATNFQHSLMMIASFFSLPKVEKIEFSIFSPEKTCYEVGQNVHIKVMNTKI